MTDLLFYRKTIKMLTPPIPRYVDHLYYPILVPLGGGNRIVEMLGKAVNEYNDRVADHNKQFERTDPRGWCI